MSQTIDLTGAQPEIDAGNLPVTLGADLGGFSTQGDNATVVAEFWKDAQTSLVLIQIGPVSAADRNSTTTLQHRSTTAIVPAGTTFAVIRVSFQRTDGTYNDGYANNLSLTLGGPPHTRITVGPAGPTNNSTPSFEFAADPAEGASLSAASTRPTLQRALRHSSRRTWLTVRTGSKSARATRPGRTQPPPHASSPSTPPRRTRRSSQVRGG